MEEFVKKTLLFDFYGELLTDHQRAIYEAVVLNDTGYSEVAAQEGISRQGVHDLIRRCDRQFAQYESKLRLMERFLHIRSRAVTIKELACAAGDTKVAALAEEILAEL